MSDAKPLSNEPIFWSAPDPATLIAKWSQPRPRWTWTVRSYELKIPKKEWAGPPLEPSLKEFFCRRHGFTAYPLPARARSTDEPGEET